MKYFNHQYTITLFKKTFKLSFFNNYLIKDWNHLIKIEENNFFFCIVLYYL